MEKSKPVITSVFELQRSVPLSELKKGRVLQTVEPGSTILIAGKNFGKSPSKIKVEFRYGESQTKIAFPFTNAFSSQQMLVTVPIIPNNKTEISAFVGESQSNKISISIKPFYTKKEETGVTTKKFFASVDELLCVISSFAYELSGKRDVPPNLMLTARSIDGLRKDAAKLTQLLDYWAEYQEKISIEPIRTVEKLDELIDVGEVIPVIQGMTKTMLRSFSTARTGNYSNAAVANTSTTMFSLAEGFELLKHIVGVLQPSFEVGLSGGVGVEGGVSVDVQLAPDELLNAIAGMIKMYAQSIGLMMPSFDPNEALQKIEAKADSTSTKLNDVYRYMDDVNKIFLKRFNETKKQIEIIEAKGDNLTSKLTSIEADLIIADKKADIIISKENKLIKDVASIEVKGDKIESKLDVLEEKADESETKLDKIEEKADIAEKKLDSLEEKADSAEKKLDSIETKADKAEAKLDASEIKLDEFHVLLHDIDFSVDKVETKADKAEAKLDVIKIDAAEAHKLGHDIDLKAGQIGYKLKKIEEKIDKSEAKLDSI